MQYTQHIQNLINMATKLSLLLIFTYFEESFYVKI